MSWGMMVMRLYLKSKEKHKDKLTIFDAPGMDNNINLLCETVFLLGVYDAIVRYWDTTFEYLKPQDSLGILGAEFESVEELKGYSTWLDQAIKQGTYTPGAYRMKDPKVEYIDTLFVAGQYSFSKLKDLREEVLLPQALGVEDIGVDIDYDFYDFSDFVLLRERFIAGLEEN